MLGSINMPLWNHIYGKPLCDAERSAALGLPVHPEAASVDFTQDRVRFEGPDAPERLTPVGCAATHRWPVRRPLVVPCGDRSVGSAARGVVQRKLGRPRTRASRAALSPQRALDAARGTSVYKGHPGVVAGVATAELTRAVRGPP